MATAPKVTKADFSKWQELEAKRLELQREAKAIAALLEPIEEKFEAFVRAKEPKKLSIATCGFVLAIQTKPGTVKWKDEFIRVEGTEAAEALSKAAPTRETLSIEPIA